MSGLHFEEFQVGSRWVTPRRTITEADVVMFAGLSGDYNPLHTDEVMARGTVFGRRIAHGLLGLSVLTGLLGRLTILDGTTLAFAGLEWKFVKPVMIGETVHGEIEVQSKRETSKPDRGIVNFRARLLGEGGQVFQEGVFTMMMRRRDGGA